MSIKFSAKRELPIGFYDFRPCSYVCDICRTVSRTPKRGIGLGYIAFQWGIK